MRPAAWVGFALVGAAMATGAVWAARAVLSGASDVETPAESVDALAEAWRAVAVAPEDPAVWILLGELQHALDQDRAAERSFRTAIALGDPGGRARGRLGFLLYGAHRDEEALALLEAAAEEGAELPLLDFVRGRLRARLAEPAQREATKPVESPEEAASLPPEPEPPGAEPPSAPERPDMGPPVEAPIREDRPCTVPLRRLGRDSTFLVGLFVEGLEAELIVDTGASLTVITQELAEVLDLPLDWERPLRAVTANGTVDFPTAVLDQVELQGRSVRELRVAVCRDCVQRVADGLLGLDLQTAFGLDLDLSDQRLAFTDCE